MFPGYRGIEGGEDGGCQPAAVAARGEPGSVPNGDWPGMGQTPAGNAGGGRLLHYFGVALADDFVHDERAGHGGVKRADFPEDRDLHAEIAFLPDELTDAAPFVPD